MSDIENQFSFFSEDEGPKKFAPISRTPLPKELPENGRPVDGIEAFNWDSGLQNNLKLFPDDCIRNHGEDVLYYLAQETRFIPASHDPDWEKQRLNPEEARAVGRGQQECRLCKDRKEVRRLMVGEKTGIRVKMPVKCSCVGLRLYYDNWTNPVNVPLEYQDTTWTALQKPEFMHRFRGMEESFVRTIFAVIKAKPDHNILMTGPAGCGKSSLMYALYDKALREWASQCYARQFTGNAVWITSMRILAEQQRDYEMRSHDRDENTEIAIPLITAGKVHSAIKAGFTPHVFFDEFEKYNMNSEFQNNQFHLIINAVQNNYGQVVTTSNIRVAGITAKLGESYGPAMVRRFVGPPRGIHIDFFRKVVEINYSEVQLRSDGVLIFAKTRERIDKGAPPTLAVTTVEPQKTPETPTPQQSAPPQNREERTQTKRATQAPQEKHKQQIVPEGDRFTMTPRTPYTK